MELSNFLTDLKNTNKTKYELIELAKRYYPLFRYNLNSSKIDLNIIIKYLPSLNISFLNNYNNQQILSVFDKEFGSRYESGYQTREGGSFYKLRGGSDPILPSLLACIAMVGLTLLGRGFMNDHQGPPPEVPPVEVNQIREALLTDDEASQVGPETMERMDMGGRRRRTMRRRRIRRKRRTQYRKKRL
jgi:hypothetical protein